ncbi:glycosyltransferase [Cellulomonas sp. P5_C5]
MVLDLLGAPSGSGGMHLYALELVRAWSRTAEDELVILAGPWAKAAFADLDHVSVHVARDDAVAGRALGQLVLSAALFRREHADAVVSVSPIVTPFVARSARTCVVHDWRHVRVPHEFPVWQRAYRRLWRWSVRRAGHVVAISEKTAAETRKIVPAAAGRIVVVANGGDHARRWKVAPPGDSSGLRSVVTFGHLSHKRPELVIDALALLPPDVLDGVRLVVLGASGQYADSLRSRAGGAADLGRVELPGFVSAEDYQTTVAGAAVVVMASTDEGFGLPVAEATFFGIPVVVTSDSGLSAVHGDSLIESEPTPAALAQAIETGLCARRHVPPTAARPWTSVARELRDVVLSGSVVRRGAKSVRTEGQHVALGATRPDDD